MIKALKESFKTFYSKCNEIIRKTEEKLRNECWDFSYLVSGFSDGERKELNHVALALEFNINHVEKGFMLLDPGIGCPLIILYEANKLFPYKLFGEIQR